MSDNPVEQVQELFPVGTYSPKMSIAAATSAAELVRYLNHASLGRSGAFEYPVHVGDVINSLAVALHGMDQLVAQLAAELRQFERTPGLYDDHGADPLETVWAAVRQLDNAQEPLAEAAKCVNAAFQKANRLGVRTPQVDA